MNECVCMYIGMLRTNLFYTHFKPYNYDCYLNTKLSHYVISNVFLTLSNNIFLSHNPDDLDNPLSLSSQYSLSS